LSEYQEVSFLLITHTHLVYFLFFIFLNFEIFVLGSTNFGWNFVTFTEKCDFVRMNICGRPEIFQSCDNFNLWSFIRVQWYKCNPFCYFFCVELLRTMWRPLRWRWMIKVVTVEKKWSRRWHTAVQGTTLKWIFLCKCRDRHLRSPFWWT